jgi:hypothetical protein
MRLMGGARVGVLAVGLLALAKPLAAQTPDATNVTDEYRFTVFPHYPISEKLSGFGYAGWVTNPESEYELWYLGMPGFIYQVKPWLQVWTGLFFIYTDNDTTSNGREDTLELRPFVGAKLFLPNTLKWNIYNLTRLEFRETYHHDTHEWTNVERLRSRFGVEIPMASRARAWQPKTLYAVANVEPMYRYDRDDIDPARAQVGVGYVANHRIRAEFLYYANWGRPHPDDDLRHTQNIWRLNVKVGLSHALLGRVWEPAHR